MQVKSLSKPPVAPAAPRLKSTSRHTVRLVLVLGLLLTANVAVYMGVSTENNAKQAFGYHCREIQAQILDKLDDYARLLHGGEALFAASDVVTREEWNLFSRRLRIENQLPGIQGFGFSLLIPQPALAGHIREIRGEGFPSYTVRPAGDREVYSSIIYIEPFSGRNLQAFGYDMWSEPVRRAAMERARDTDAAALSAKVVLVQETAEDVQPGVLMYVPVYRKGMPTASVAQRRAAIRGWVYSPYRMNDLMRGLLGSRHPEKEDLLQFRVFDGAKPSPESLLYDSRPAGRDAVARMAGERFTWQAPVDFNGHRWTLRFAQAGGGPFAAEYASLWLILLLGPLITWLLCALIAALLNRTAAVKQLADAQTVVLHEKTALLTGLLASIPDIIFFKDPAGVYLGCNPEFARLVGRDVPGVVGATDQDLFGRETADFFRVQDRLMMDRGESHHNEEWIQYPDGARVLIDTLKAPLRDADGQVIGLLGVSRDITARKQAESEVRKMAERLALATRAGGVGIWDWDVANNRLVWDEQMYRIYGITADTFSGAYDAWQAGLHPQDRARGDLEIQMALRGEKEFDTQFRVCWPDGSIRNIHAFAIVHRDAAGRPLRMIGTNWDVTAQAQLEEKLKSSEENFRTFFQSADDIVVVSAPGGGILFANPAFLHKLGYTRDDMAALQLLGLYPAECRKEAGAAFDAMMHGEQAFCPLPIQTKSGAALPVEARVWHGRWDGAECVFSTFKDLAAQQAALDKFEKMFRHNPSLMFICSMPDRIILDVNDAFLTHLGAARGEVVGRTAGELNLFEDPSVQARIDADLESRGRVLDVEMKIRNKPGQFSDGLLSGEIIDSQGAQVLLIIIADLAALKKSQAALARTESMRNLLMELASQHINIPLDKVDDAIRLSLRKMGEFVAADRAYVFRYEFEKKITANEYEWCAAGVEPQIEQLQDVPLAGIPEWVAAHAGGRSLYIEDVDALPPGNLRDILAPQGIKSLITVPMMEDQHCMGFAGFDSVKTRYAYTGTEIALLTFFSQMLVNVRRREKTERDLVDINKDLAAATAKADGLAAQAILATTAKSRFLAHMSHEIRTPLNAILGFAQLLQYDPELTPGQRPRVEIINRSGEHLLALLNDILELSKIEAGGIALAPAAFDLHGLLDDLAMMFRIRAESRNLTLHADGVEQAPRYLVADEQKLRQVLINLLGNAVKYTREGGIWLRVAVEPAGAVLRLVIRVEDSGPGIAADEMDRLFVSFEQADAGRRSGAGTGLGLAISRQLAQLMGGDVTVASEVGKGSIFTLDVPVMAGVAPAAADADARHVLRIVAGQPACRVLVAEDDGSSRLLIVQMLGAAGFEVAEAANGREAVAAFAAVQPGLILMDDGMPVMGGNEAIRLIRQSPGGRAVKILMLTANASGEARLRSTAAGADDFMAKPFRMAVLFEKIRDLTGIRYDSVPPARQDPAPAITQDLMRALVDTLPAELRRQMCAATISGHQGQLLKLIQQAVAITPEIGETLRGMAARFDYNALIQLLN